MIPVARNVWQHVDAGSPAAAARRLNHRQHGPAHERPTAQPARPVDALKQRRLRVVVVEARGVEIRLDGLLGPVVGRHVVALAALLVQPQPAPHALPGSSPAAASPPPRSTRAKLNTITLSSARSRSPTSVPVSIRSRNSRVSAGVRTGVAPLGDDVLRAPDRRGRVHGST